jgi:hypothetical protein
VDTVIATFTRRATAERAAAKVRAELGPGLVVAVGEREDVLDALAVNQRAEIGDAAMAPSVGLWTGPMIRGGLLWGVVGLVAGAVLALPMLLLVDWPEDERWTFVLAVAAIGALALSSATFLIGAVRRAQKEGAFTPEDPWAVVRVEPREGQHAVVIAMLGEAGARSVRHLDGPVARRSSSDVETPRAASDDRKGDDWPASQRGARSS